MDDFDVVADMVKRAGKAGMLIEVINSFADEIYGGEKDYGKAAQYAMREWDV